MFLGISFSEQVFLKHENKSFSFLGHMRYVPEHNFQNNISETIYPKHI